MLIALFFCSRASFSSLSLSFSSSVSSTLCLLRSSSSAFCISMSVIPRSLIFISFVRSFVLVPTIVLKSLNFLISNSSSLSSSSLYNLGSSKPFRRTRSMIAFLRCSSMVPTWNGFISPPSAARIGQKFKKLVMASFCSGVLVLPDLWLSSMASATSLSVRSGAKSKT